MKICVLEAAAPRLSMRVFLDGLDLFLDLAGEASPARDTRGARAGIERTVAPGRIRENPHPRNLRGVVASARVRLVGAVCEANALGNVTQPFFVESDAGNALVKRQVVVLPPVAHAVEENHLELGFGDGAVAQPVNIVSVCLGGKVRRCARGLTRWLARCRRSIIAIVVHPATVNAPAVIAPSVGAPTVGAPAVVAPTVGAPAVRPAAHIKIFQGEGF
jgi:hypothetical protein